jgi:hypothetical protein
LKKSKEVDLKLVLEGMMNAKNANDTLPFTRQALKALSVLCMALLDC